MITPNDAAGYRRRNASGAVVSAMPSTMRAVVVGRCPVPTTTSWCATPGTGWTMKFPALLDRFRTTAAQTAASVATTAMAVSTALADQVRTFTPSLSPRSAGAPSPVRRR